MAWSVVQSVSHNDASGAVTVAATFTTANLTSGTKLIAAVATDTGASPTVSQVSDGTNNFTKILEQAVGGSAGTVSLWVLDTPSGDVGTKPTITATTNVTSASSILVQEVSGLVTGTTGSVDGTAAGTSGSTTGSIGPPTYATTASSEYLVYVYGDNGGPLTWTVPGGYTGDTNGINSSGNADIQIAWKNSTSGTETGQYSLSGTATGWGLIMAAFKIVGGGTSSGPPLFPPDMGTVPSVIVSMAGWRGANHSR